MVQRLLSLRIVRFGLVGVLNTAFSYGVYAGLLYAGLGYVWANLLALVIGILFSFRTQGALVFNNRDHRLIGRFALCWGLIWLVNVGLIAALVRAGFDAYWAGALALPPVTLLSFFMQKVLVFAPAPQTRGNP